MLKLLFQLYRMDLVEIIEERELKGRRTLLDRRAPGATRMVATPLSASTEDDEAVDDTSEPGDLSIEIEVSRRLLARGEYEPALELLNATFRANPGNYEVGELLARAESGFIEKTGGLALSSKSVPMVVEDAETPALGAEESFLLSLIDGQFDVQSILSLATLREADVLKTLEQMLDKGMIQLAPDKDDQSNSVGNRSPNG